MNRKLIIITAPSGSGKTSIAKELIAKIDNLEFSISACTRKKRKKEKHGVDYYFITSDEFRNSIKNGDFIEWEEVYNDQFYGTLRKEIQRLWDAGKNVLFDVDVKGAVSLKEQFGDQAMTLFIKTPSLEVLEERLRKRHTESEQSLKKRLTKAGEELLYEEKFDQVVVNDILDDAIKESRILVENFLRI